MRQASVICELRERSRPDLEKRSRDKSCQNLLDHRKKEFSEIFVLLTMPSFDCGNTTNCEPPEREQEYCIAQVRNWTFSHTDWFQTGQDIAAVTCFIYLICRGTSAV